MSTYRRRNMGTETKPKVKRGPSARTILTKAIADIKAGLWSCGDLVDGRTGDTEKDAKVMGCALGLVGVHAGMATIKVEKRAADHWNPEPYFEATAYLNYPSEDEASGKPWPAGAKKAIRLLAGTTGLKKREVHFLLDDNDGCGTNLDNASLSSLSGVVVGKNDSYCRTPASALKWFQRALARLDA
jgi:hypothetical protein